MIMLITDKLPAVSAAWMVAQFLLELLTSLHWPGICPSLAPIHGSIYLLADGFLYMDCNYTRAENKASRYYSKYDSTWTSSYAALFFVSVFPAWNLKNWVLYLNLQLVYEARCASSHAVTSEASSLGCQVAFVPLSDQSLLSTAAYHGRPLSVSCLCWKFSS